MFLGFSMKNRTVFTPNRALLGSVEKLCLQSDPYKVSLETDLLFIDAMKEITRWHQEKSIFYRQFLKDSSFDINRWTGNLSELPSLPAEFFKYHEVKTLSDEKIHIHLTSSGTSGQKSQMFFDESEYIDKTWIFEIRTVGG